MLYIKDCVKSKKSEFFLKSQVQSNIKHQIAKHPLSISLIELKFYFPFKIAILYHWWGFNKNYHCMHTQIKLTFKIVLNIPGTTTLQNLSSVFTPIQSVPPLDGGGESQDRNRDWDPSPEVTLQADHVVHSDQLPFTGTSKLILRRLDGCDKGAFHSKNA